MSEFDDFMAGAFDEALGILGTTEFFMQGLTTPLRGVWNDLGRTEDAEINGRRVRFSVIVEAARAQFTTPPTQGLRVTRGDEVFRISGEVSRDELTFKFLLDSVNR